MKRLLFIVLFLLVFTACEKDKRLVNPNIPDPNTDEKIKTNYGITAEFRGQIYSSLFNDTEIYLITDTRTGKKYLMFSKGNDGIFVIEEKKEKGEYNEDR